MVGVLIITHLRLAEELLKTAEFIVGKIQQVRTLCLAPDTDVDHLHKDIEKAIKEVDDGDGVLLLVDMLGGTPSNLGLSFLEEGRIEVVTGVNLPMVLKLANRGDQSTLSEIAGEILNAGQRGISLAGDILNWKSR